ncbi:hypothetical protein QEN19_000209 [Hanseniaspora menglaensis]
MASNVKRTHDESDNEYNEKNVMAKTNGQNVPTNNTDAPSVDDEMGEFEDPYGDDFESDGEIIQLDDEDDDDENMDGDEGESAFERKQQKAEDMIKMENEQEKENGESSIYLPHLQKPLGENEVLEADPTVYEMLHTMQLPWPCMSIDIVPDMFGNERRTFPQSMQLVSATQAAKKKDNELLVLKLTRLVKTLAKDEEEDIDEDEDDDDLDVDPIIENANAPLIDTTNRLKISPFAVQTSQEYNNEILCASMSENGQVLIHDLQPQYKAMNVPGFSVSKKKQKSIHTVMNHGSVEGYAVDWSPLNKNGSLLTGDTQGNIYLTTRNPETQLWETDSKPYTCGNGASIEDIQWSKTEPTVFATCGTDGYLRIWDIRSKKHKPSINIPVSNTDLNVISWSEKLDYLLCTGDDAGVWSVWDLRQFNNNNAADVKPVASYNFHKGAITSIQFNPLDESIVAVASEDNTVTLWDLSVEADDDEVKEQYNENKELQEIPAQLLFVHWQREVKDVKWHKQIPGCLVSTGGDGLVVWKTISV